MFLKILIKELKTLFDNYFRKQIFIIQNKNTKKHIQQLKNKKQFFFIFKNIKQVIFNNFTDSRRIVLKNNVQYIKIFFKTYLKL